MGATCCVKVQEVLSASDRILFWQTVIIGVQTIIIAIGIGVSAGVGIWIVRTMQDRLTNKRVLKDHLMQEVKDLRDEYREFLKGIYTDKTIGAHVMPWFKLMDLKIDDLMDIANAKYKIAKTMLAPYQKELLELITENKDFEQQFKSGLAINFKDESKTAFIIFEQNHNHLFNDIIIAINDAD